jgi:hypothetical protein
MAPDPNDREISLADLAPERLTFWDTAYGGDGSRHEWRMVADLGLEDVGTLRRIQDELARAAALLGKQASSADELDAAAQKMRGGIDAFLHLMLPTLPRERLTAIPLQGKERLLKWWQARQPQGAAADGLPLAQAARATPRGKRSRASSRATA